ncbi:PLATZ transcription factor family protein [Forsythia ovata]|uniref:PLATZ transcription factor family protein n=1 Tax=Forsythia ovata TaxID=205694 RepID=A0ABD1UAS3_9LAMI
MYLQVNIIFSTGNAFHGIPQLICCDHLIEQLQLFFYKNLKMRRSSYHSMVRVNEIQKRINISCIRTHTINNAEIVFLYERPQPRPRMTIVKFVLKAFSRLSGSVLLVASLMA